MIAFRLAESLVKGSDVHGIIQARTCAVRAAIYMGRYIWPAAAFWMLIDFAIMRSELPVIQYGRGGGMAHYVLKYVHERRDVTERYASASEMNIMYQH